MTVIELCINSSSVNTSNRIIHNLLAERISLLDYGSCYLDHHFDVNRYDHHNNFYVLVSFLMLDTACSAEPLVQNHQSKLLGKILSQICLLHDIFCKVTETFYVV